MAGEKEEGMSEFDTEILNFLQRKNDESKYTGLCIFRMSSSGRGWRLHETSRKNGTVSVRKAILDAMRKEERCHKMKQ